MLLRPQMVASQMPGLQALNQLVAQYPVCEAWIKLLTASGGIVTYWGSLSPQGLNSVGQISDSVAKVLRYIQGNAPGYVPVFQYIAPLAIGAHDVSVSAYLAAINASGSLQVVLSAAAVGALGTLQAWDDALNLNVPANPGQVGLVLVSGITIGVALA